MKKHKEIKLIIHPPKPENTEKLQTTLSAEYARLIEALLCTPKEHKT